MPDDQPREHGHRPVRPHLQVTIGSEETQQIASHPVTPDSLNNTSGETTDKEMPVHPDALSSKNKASVSSPAKAIPFWHPASLPPTLQWIPANWTWSKWKPVLRSALAAWICLLLFLIPATLNVMGQVSVFFILVSLTLDLRDLQAAFLIVIGKLLEDPSRAIF